MSWEVLEEIERKAEKERAEYEKQKELMPVLEAEVAKAKVEIPPLRRKSLFELGLEGQSLEMQLEAALIESEGEITPEVEKVMDAFLNENPAAVESKLDSIGAVLAEWGATAAARKAEAKRLTELARIDENKAARLKERVLVYLELTGKTKVETERYKFSVATSGGKAPLVFSISPSGVPERFVIPSYDYDKDAIRAALESGEELEFAKLGERGKSLRIR